MPKPIQFKNGCQIKHTYSAGGQKLSSRYVTVNAGVYQPLNPGQIIENLDVNENDNVTVEGMDYIGNIEYQIYRYFDWDVTFEPAELKYIYRLHNPEGFATNATITYGPIYSYYRKDHLGNNREEWRASYTWGGTTHPAATVQRTEYYPSGLPWQSNSGDNPGSQPYKYGGKEFVEMHGLDEYDSEARWYYPAIMRTTTPDPLAEMYYDISPYAWCGNNPVKFVDPDGSDWYSYQEEYIDESGNVQTRTQYKYVEGQMSKKEMKEGGYTHLGKTYDNGNGTYFSLGGSQISYDKDNALNVIAINRLKSADNTIVTTIDAFSNTGKFWDNYKNLINMGTDAANIISEYMDLSKKFKGAVSFLGGIVGVNQLYQDYQSFRNGNLKGDAL